MLYVTDSGASLFHVDPTTYEVVRKLPIIDRRLGGKHIHGVNELEWVDGELWGNVYPMYQRSYSECIVRINASTGRVLGWLDMRGLFARQRPTVRAQPMSFVLNGIAFHAPSKRLIVTGKRWDEMYQVHLQPLTDAGPEHIESVCNLG